MGIPGSHVNTHWRVSAPQEEGTKHHTEQDDLACGCHSASLFGCSKACNGPVHIAAMGAETEALSVAWKDSMGAVSPRQMELLSQLKAQRVKSWAYGYSTTSPRAAGHLVADKLRQTSILEGGGHQSLCSLQISVFRSFLCHQHHYLRFYTLPDIPHDLTSVPGSRLWQMRCSKEQKTRGCTGPTPRAQYDTVLMIQSTHLAPRSRLLYTIFHLNDLGNLGKITYSRTGPGKVFKRWAWNNCLFHEVRKCS